MWLLHIMQFGSYANVQIIWKCYVWIIMSSESINSWNTLSCYWHLFYCMTPADSLFFVSGRSIWDKLILKWVLHWVSWGLKERENPPLGNFTGLSLALQMWNVSFWDRLFPRTRRGNGYPYITTTLILRSSSGSSVWGWTLVCVPFSPSDLERRASDL